MGLTRKIIAVSTLGTTVNYRSRDERMERAAKQTAKATKELAKIEKKREKIARKTR